MYCSVLFKKTGEMANLTRISSAGQWWICHCQQVRDSPFPAEPKVRFFSTRCKYGVHRIRWLNISARVTDVVLFIRHWSGRRSWGTVITSEVVHERAQPTCLTSPSPALCVHRYPVTLREHHIRRSHAGFWWECCGQYPITVSSSAAPHSLCQCQHENSLNSIQVWHYTKFQSVKRTGRISTYPRAIKKSLTHSLLIPGLLSPHAACRTCALIWVNPRR